MTFPLEPRTVSAPLVVVIIGYILPFFGLELLDMARDVAAFNLPVRVGPLFGSACSEHPPRSRESQTLTICRGEVYRGSSQAGPGNDINAGSAGSQKAPT